MVLTLFYPPLYCFHPLFSYLYSIRTPPHHSVHSTITFGRETSIRDDQSYNARKVHSRTAHVRNTNTRVIMIIKHYIAQEFKMIQL